MSASGVEVHFCRNVGVLQSQKVNGGVFDMHRIIFGLKNERRRGLVSNADFGIGREVLVGEGEVARVDDHSEVRAAAELVSGIDRNVESLVEVGSEYSCKVSSGRETEHADAVRINVPLDGVGADDPDGALGILERGRVGGIGSGVGHAIFDQHAADASRVQPVAHLSPLEVNARMV